ncbi:MAG: hypothetical protein ACJA13_001342 [Paraglaciecola sp.]|jgi:hypothetical protein
MKNNTCFNPMAIALAGVTLLATTYVPESQATTITLDAQEFYIQVSGSSKTLDLNFAAFDTNIGTLTGVNLTLDAYVGLESGTLLPTTSILINSNIIESQTAGHDWDNAIIAVTNVDLSFFSTSPQYSIQLQLNDPGNTAAYWNGQDGIYSQYNGLSISYEYEETVAEPAPEPGSIAFLGLGLVAFGLYSKRRDKTNLTR